MKKRKHSKFSLVILIVFIINMGFFNLKVSASPEDLKYKTFSLGSDVNFKGVFSSHSMYFDIDKYVQAKSLESDVYFNVSQLIDDKKNATITFSINGTALYSSQVVYNPSEETQNIKVPIPVTLIKEGMNEFKIDTYSRISDESCSDDVNNANWITLKGSSNISMGFNDKESTNNISEFTYPFIKVNEENKYNATIVIPDNYKPGELSAALMLQAYFGKVNKNGDYSGSIIKYSAVQDDKDIIYIGGINNLPEEIKSLYSGNSKENFNDCAIIKKENSPFNENNKLMAVVSENGDMLTKAVKLLMNKDLVSQLNVDNFKVDNNLKVDDDLSEEKSNFTFKELGLQEMQLKGPFRQSGSLGYTLPRNKVLSNGAKIKLFTRYSQNLDFNRSLLTVYVNGTPIGSKKLDKDKCNGDQLELPIPKDIKMSNYMDIKIAFDLEQPNSNCQFRQEEMPWALVTGDSYIYIPSSKADFYKFDNYPQPFISNKQFNDVAVVVPENLSENEIEGISKLFSYIGRDVDYNNGTLKVVEEKNFSREFYNMNLIVYGTPEKNKVIKQLNSKLWFQYDKNFKSFVGNEKLYLTEPYASNISTFQFDISPYNKQRAILTLTSSKEDLLLKSLIFLSNSNQILKLSGDSVLIDGYGNIKTFKFKKENTKSTYERFSSVETNTKVFAGFMGLFLVFSIAAIGLYHFKNKRFK